MNKPFSAQPRQRSSRIPLVARRAARFGLALLALVIAYPAQSRADNKIALVVGNSDYRTVGKLTNPVNDAADMAASLTRLGFTVTHLDDLDFNGFRRALIEFGNAARSADKAVIYFAGHGVEIDGKNWLIPVDAEIKSEIDVYAEGINLETLIDISVLPKVIGLVVLDACRNNPFIPEKLASGRSLSLPVSPAAPNAGKPPIKDAVAPSSKSSTAALPPDMIADNGAHGLAPVEVTDNVLVAFAAAAGTTANDGDGRNSPYSGALLRYVEKPGLEINYLFRNVHDDVVKETRFQEPAVYGTLSKDEIYLREAEARVAADDDDEATAEKLAWPFVRTTNDIATLHRFLEWFPSGAHAAEIRERITQLEAAERLAWSIVERQPSSSAYRAFLDLYPYSEHVESARTTLALLEAAGPQQPDGQAVDLPKPPASTYQVASVDADNKTSRESSESIDKAWDVLKDSRDPNVVTRFSENYPSLRRRRLPPGSDLALRPVNSTEWMLRTAQDDDVNGCFGGDSEACVKAIDKYPDYVQLRFQLCRSTGHPNGCMLDAVEDARQRGYLVSAFTRSAAEIARNNEYRTAVQRVQQDVGNIVSDVVSQVVGNVVSDSVGNAVGIAAANRAMMMPPLAAMTGSANDALASAPLLTGSGKWNTRLGTIKASLPTSGTTKAAPGAPTAVKGGTVTSPITPSTARLPSSVVTPTVHTPTVTNVVPNAAGGAASKAAGHAASNAAGHAASTAAGQAASHAASNAASHAATNAASHAASNAASHAASNAASHAASNAASRAASNAAARAAANAASNIHIPSDIRLKQDIIALGRAPNGLRLYRYRYIGDDTLYVGVMAQDVAKRVPAAVSRRADGYLQVDYGRLGIQFLTYEEWTRRHAVDATN
ncbi:caspase family protein [Bradyrhizobium sp. S69]|uniref:caspase family protein n=1 Tax=Bradyrhizobium sp. S69 TaxID=1641856 RepID=UPI00131B5502|nr:caspase family protein [Bradyrhizobium sp. S69]